MKIGIISDTHNNTSNVARARKIFHDKNVSYILHAGDITTPATAVEFIQLDGAKPIMAFGNCDFDREIIKDVIEEFGGICVDCYQGDLHNRKIFMQHNPRNLHDIIDSGQYDLVIYGHTHKQDIRHIANTLVINPGSSRDRLLRSDPEIVIVNLEDMSYETVAIK